MQSASLAPSETYWGLVNALNHDNLEIRYCLGLRLLGLQVWLAIKNTNVMDGIIFA